MTKANYVKKIDPVEYVLIAFVSFAIMMSFVYLIYRVSDSPNESESTITNKLLFLNGNVINQTLVNYYDVTYSEQNDKTIITFNNPCITLSPTIGDSMKPFFESSTLSIVDECYNKSKLKVGDVIILNDDFSYKKIQHRITKINIIEGWVKTKGDNPKTNPNEDDITGFEFIRGKLIGTLNVLEEKKVLEERVENESYFSNQSRFGIMVFRQYCFCSSTGILKICSNNRTQMLEDSFIISGSLKEEYCKVVR